MSAATFQWLMSAIVLLEVIGVLWHDVRRNP